MLALKMPAWKLQINRPGILARHGPAERCWLQRNAEALDLLVQLTMQAAEAGEIGAQQLANIAYGAACIKNSGRGKWIGGLFQALESMVGQHMVDFNGQNLANTA